MYVIELKTKEQRPIMCGQYELPDLFTPLLPTGFIQDTGKGFRWRWAID